MKKLFKKSISCIVAVLMVLSSMPFTALTANAALVKQDKAVWDAANVTAATPDQGTKIVYTDSSTEVTINGVHWGSSSKVDGNGYVTFNNATLSSEDGFASLNIKGDVWTFSSKFAITGSGQDDHGTQQTTNNDSTIFGIGTATTHTYSPSGAAKTSGMAADLVNITYNGNIYLAGSTTSSGTVANITSTSADDAKILTAAYDNGTLTISLDGTTAYTGTVDPALFSKGVANFFIGTSAQVYAGGIAPYYGLTNDGYYTYGTHLYSLSASVSYDPTIVPPSENAQIAKNNINNANRTYNNVSFTGADTNYLNGVIKGTSFGGSTTATVNGFSDSTSTKHESKVHGLTDGVAIYTGSECDIRFPVVYEHLKGGNKFGVTHYVGIDHLYFSSGNFQLGQDTWKRCSNWNNLTDNSDNSHDFSALSTGNVDRAENTANGRFNGKDQKYWKNYIKYTGSVNTDTYYEKLTSAEFNYQADYTWSWWSGGTKWSSNSNYKSTFSSNFGLYVINYAPLKEIIESEDFKSNFERIYNNRANYNETEREHYFDVMADITTFDLSTRTMTNDDEVSAVAAEIKDMVDRYNQYKEPTPLGYTVTFVNASDSTIESRFVQSGNEIGEFPANTATAPDAYGFGATHHNKYTWDTELTAESVPTSDITINEKATLQPHSSTTPATCITKQTCDACGAEFGSFGSHNLTETAAKDATCTEDGNSSYWTCSTCKKMFSDAEATTEITDIPTISASGHSLTKVDEVPSTCTVHGTAAYWTCTECNKKFSDENGTVEISEPNKLPLAKHEYVVTSKDDDKHIFTCKNCTASYDEAHTWGDYAETTPATCTDNAVETATCTVAGCGATTSREVADSKLGHDYKYAELDADNHTVTCSRCDYLAQAPHRFDENNTCTDCGYVKVTIDTTAYDNAVAEYEEIIGAGDYAEKYTEASRTDYQNAVTTAMKDSFATLDEVNAAVTAILSAKTKLVYAKADVKVYIAREGVEPVLVDTISKNYGETADINVAANLSAGEQILKWVIETQEKKVNTKLATTDTTVSMVVTEPADVYVHIATEKSTEAVQYSKVSFISKNGAVSFVKYVPAGETLYTNTVDGVEIPFYKFVKWNKDSVVANGSDIEVKAVYEFIGTVENKCRVHYDGFDGGEKEYTYDSFVYLFGAEDKTLALASDAAGTNIITYLNENAFYAPHTADIYVIEVDSQPASIGITGSYVSSTDTKKTAAFNCKFFLPSDCKVVEYGLTATSSTGMSMKIKGEKASARGEYCVKATMNKTSPVTSVEGVAYLTYKDKDNNLHTIYSTTVTQNLL